MKKDRPLIWYFLRPKISVVLAFKIYPKINIVLASQYIFLSISLLTTSRFLHSLLFHSLISVL
uniref:Uncharacterized protein n=1 Tax=Arundo donax TaxID=35708 RepID=A0A0A9FLH2_ARUDO